MSLIKWNPFETISDIQTDIDQLFARHLMPVKAQGKLHNEATLFAPVDIHEDKENLYFDIEVPGLKKEDIDVNIEGSVLTLKGHKKNVVEQKDKNYFRIEREYGSFQRSFTLPESADAAKVTAAYEQGVLKVKVAKKEVATPKKIEVKLAS